jgi:hypothetical protein
MPGPNEFAEYVRWLGQQAFGGLLYGWPITVALALAIAVAGVWQLRRCRSFLQLLVLIVPLTFPLLFLIWGTIMRVPAGSSPPSWPQTVLLLLFIAQLGIGVASVFFTAGARWFAAFIVAFSLWCGYWCALLGVMSVGGVWL